ncbi:unnamed protein product [Ostreobium quekettii]|uniref:FAD dependent oxidoreductase domain-containing protein n=1 Tax=Ostreobium quekettii TaxID=121088 RepID=A0A8S1IJW2_9CHLO|nr:unnamed protein product [Ostreobium quekettii]
MGSAALYHLAKAKFKVLGLDKFGPGHKKGSSHGDTRIIRKAYHEHPSYVPLLKESTRLWRELEGETGQPLLHNTGCLSIGDACKPARDAAVKHGLDHVLLSGREVNRQYLGYNLPDDMPALYEAGAGILESEKCIAAHCEVAKSAGTELRWEDGMTAWKADGSGVQVTTTKGGTYLASRLVLCCGAWIGEVVPQLKTVCIPERQVVAWFDTQDDPRFAFGAFPVCMMIDGGPSRSCYAFPNFRKSGDDYGWSRGVKAEA